MNINKLLRENPRPCRYGAPMGAVSYYRDPDPLYLQKVRMVDGDYAPDGTYWGGGGMPLWCAFNDDSRIYIRAWTRGEAIAEVRREFAHDAAFKRGAA